MKLFRRKPLREIWANEPQMAQHYRGIWDTSPVLRRFYRDLWCWGMAGIDRLPRIEVGGGGGFIREHYPDIITTDILPFPESSVRCDASRLPFRDGSIGGIIGLAFFHHCTNPARFFIEVDRVLAPGGRIAIVDPYISPLSRIVYRFGTEEALDLTEEPFEREERDTPRPLLEANVARLTIVFARHREEFERRFPQLKIIAVERKNLLRHIAAGSCVQQSPFPQWCYPIASAIDTIFQPFAASMGMAMRVVLEKEH